MPDKTAVQGTTMTPGEVVEIFRLLGLKVTDDNRAIEEAVKKRKARYLRDMNSPDPQVRARAQQWFKDVDLLQRKQDQTLDVIYRAVVKDLDVALAGYIATGKSTITSEMVDMLEEIIKTNYTTDDSLAAGFRTKYMRERSLKMGAPLLHVEPVNNFQARSGLGKITLSWENPAQDFDRVLIVRRDTVDGSDKTVYEGNGTTCTDTTAKVGRWYSYRAVSVYKDVKSPGPVAADPDRVINIGEVSGQRARWQKGVIRLAWQLPSPAASVLIFRREGAAPEVRWSNNIPWPLSSHTRLVHTGSGSSWDDRDVGEDASLHYLIIVRFDQTLHSRGVVVQCRTPKAPPAPTGLSLSYQPGTDGDAVALTWPPVPGNMAVEYLLLRREGPTPPASPDEGEIVVRTAQLGFTDTRVRAGRCYSYALFTVTGEDLYSRSGVRSARVDITPEVTGLSCKPGDGTVALEWTRPAAATGVVIRRRLGPPKNALDGRSVPLTGTASAVDDNLRNGTRYHYRVCCEYRPAGSTPVYSPGLVISAVPVGLPQPVEKLETKMENLEIICSWPDSDYGEKATVVIYRSENPHGRQKGTRIDLADLDRLFREIKGDVLVTAVGGRAVDTAPVLEKPYYSAVTIAGDHCVIGATSHCLATPDVDNLDLTATRDGIILRWDWPADCNAVTVTRKIGSWPSGPDDAQATSVMVSREDYLNAGGRYGQNLRQAQGHFFYVVYAQAIADSGTVHALGVTPGCRADTFWRPWMNLSYDLPRERPHRRKGMIRLRWQVSRPDRDFAGFMLLADQDKVPAGADDGVELFRWTPPDDDFSGSHEAWVPLEPIVEQGWRDFYCKAVLLNPVQENSTLLIHPDVCRPIAASGGADVSNGKNGDSFDFHITPKTALCPFCFNRFPIDRILFQPDGGGPPVPGVRSFLDRIFKRPIRPPRTKNGSMTRKICPECKENLPSSAGVQKDLVIGMVGAKYSGKSHYVAALVHELEGRASRDMHSSLLPLNDPTIIRYKNDFYKPLFENNLELDATAGVPPPLIYDLSFDARLWNNGSGRGAGVTLALYDTAGENFDDTDHVRQLVQYLRVASGVILLVDPLQSADMQDFLPPALRSESRVANADPLDIISRVIRVLREKQVIGEDGFFDKPVAMVMTKCDVLQQSGLLPQNRLWAMNERHVGRFRRSIHEDMSGMMGEQLQRWNLPAYRAVLSHFPRHAFFGVSATGCAPDRRGRFPYVAPWRVVDPLFWILSELGVIPASSG